ncbi:response regulator [Polycladidibacter stylochi]|uniref:response regulator n=1 Tax=Polycladidibacter stylochi TaxID=1807766 RepID=UPI0008302DEB|nr:response regulator [Pseudovibrio stylochi]
MLFLGLLITLFTLLWLAVRTHYKTAMKVTEAKGDVEEVTTSAVKFEDSMQSTQYREKIFGAAEADKMDAVVIRCDVKGKVLYINKAACNIFRDEHLPHQGEMLSLPLIPASNHPLHEVDISNQEMDYFTKEVAMETRFGMRWFSRLDLSIKDEYGNPSIVQIVLKDISLRRELEYQLRQDRDKATHANESKTRFLAMISHEMRTPLNGIIGMAGLIKDTQLTPEQSTYVDAIDTSGDTLLKLIDELLDYSKIESERVEITPETIEVRHLVDDVVELMAPKAHDKGLEIGAYVNSEIPKTLVVDGARLKQILHNLIWNAIKFTDRGGIALKVGSAALNEKYRGILFSLQDTGPGLSTTDPERLFVEFEQLDHGPSRKYGGAGLGLAISRRLAKLMGGDLSALTKEDGGANFTLCLPLISNESQQLETELFASFMQQVIPQELDFTGCTQRALSHSQPLKNAAFIPALGPLACIITTRQLEANLLELSLRDLGFQTQVCSENAIHKCQSFTQSSVYLIDYNSFEEAREWQDFITSQNPIAKTIILLPPSERTKIPALKQLGFSAYLIRPIRSRSLTSILNMLNESTDQLAAITEPTIINEGILESGYSSVLPQKSDDYEKIHRRLRVLVAEDNQINWMLTEALLKKMGHQSERAQSGIEAISAINESTFDLVLMDLHMPEMDGLEAIKHIRRTGNQVPIIAVSADILSETQESVFASGGNGFLKKPFDASHIRKEIEKIFLGSLSVTQ